VRQPSRIALGGVALLLLAAVGSVYTPVVRHDFVNYDDNTYVTQNYRVQEGLSVSGALWAAKTFHESNWHPLTWLSHMIDWELFGDWAGGHHLSSVILHGVSTVVLFLLLFRLTGRAGRSAFVAAWFGLHPLHVESVAWVAERKEVLSTLFGWLTIGAWIRYARGGGGRWYIMALLLFVATLCCKPMWVTLPLLLLLMDLWPLQRFTVVSCRTAAGRRLLWEKLPLLLVAAVSSIVTILAQRTGTAMVRLEALPLAARLGNAVLSYAVYLVQAVWPARLCVHYPHPGTDLPLFPTLSALALLIAISLWVVRGIPRTQPQLFGWGWYLLTLIPVIGIVQVGSQGHADHYTYMPLVGIFIAVVWCAGDLLERQASPTLSRAGFGLALVVTLAMALVSHQQLRQWKDSFTLWQRAIAVAESARAHNGLGGALSDAGRPRQALESFRRALALDPSSARTWNNIAVGLDELGRSAEAIEHFNRALALRPDYAQAWNNLGVALARQGRHDEARTKFEAAVALRQDYGRAWLNLAAACLVTGDMAAWAEAMARARGLGL
jgi:hypothetical protein